MEPKTLHVLEYAKILERLAEHCDFSASADLARALQPSTRLDEILRRQDETSEARRLLDGADASVGGAHDMRRAVDLARHGGVLEPQEMLDIQSTLIAGRTLKKLLIKNAEACPRLAEMAAAIPELQELVDAIGRTIADNGEVLDSASPRLASLRSEARVAHERLVGRLQRYLTDGSVSPMLQDALITQRDGRYVLPLRAEFKGRIKSIVHDQSSTGATLFVEPLAVVEMNNAYRELQLAERDEARRVLADLSLQVGAQAEAITWGIEALAELDLAFAKAKYASGTDASEPVIREAGAERPVIRLHQARHPLLDPPAAVPVDILLSPETRSVVITGPNTGGKTVTLKTVGLLALMSQTGLHIPALSGSEMPVFGAVHADIGDEQSIEQSLSTFSGHITNIIQILKTADEHSLVILDELGAGTDPQEGAALARAILTHFLSGGVTTFVATHYPELKTYAQVTPGVTNASLEFDLRTLRPTYKLTIGLPGRSNALAIAQRLGLPEAILESARSQAPADELRADKLLDDIHYQKKTARKEREKAEKARIESHRLRRELAEKLDGIEAERQAILEKAQAEAEAQVATLQAEVQDLKRLLQRARQPLEEVKAIAEKADLVEEKVQKKVTRRKYPIPPAGGAFAVGEKVVLKKLGSQGVVTAVDGGEVEVQIGALRMRARPGDLERKEEAPPTEAGKRKAARTEESQAYTTASLAPSPGMELDLRGQASDDALDLLERYLDRAYSAGMPFVRIIHGKGTGKLRMVVREALKHDPRVASFEEGGAKEGGEGVTVALIAAE
ncbi:MAG: endonuclease MutS2 [Chloroflexi bacterium]|nr:endonuclease MutS2 [Chloroflexota bacterium]